MMIRRTALAVGAVGLLLTAPATAQSGDCTAETGTSTTWEIIDPDPDRPTARYTFYTGGLSGYQVLDQRRPSGGVDLVTYADRLCPTVDSSKLEDEQEAARRLVAEFAPDAGLVLPAFPEVCTPRPPGADAIECRQQLFHELIFREWYPQGGPNAGNRADQYRAAVGFAAAFSGIYDWMKTAIPQGGRGLNDNQVETWLGVGVINHQRLNNFASIESSLSTDANNWPDRTLN